jgi:hypothetical protein
MGQTAAGPRQAKKREHPQHSTRGLSRLLLALACLATAASLSGCFLEEDKEEGEPLREGLAVSVGGIEYTVFITRELNLALPDDRGYWEGEEAGPGFALYGVFIQACNRSGDNDDDDVDTGTYAASDDFMVTDTQGNEYEPLEIEEENVFQYHARELAPGECIPIVGSNAQLGPTGGAMLPFEFPLEAGENRPLELEIRAAGEEGLVELDL